MTDANTKEAEIGPPPAPTNPNADNGTFGALKDHPLWPAVRKAIEEDRRDDIEKIAATVPTPPAAKHPYTALAGKYKDDPAFDDLLAAIAEARRQANEEESARLDALDAKEQADSVSA